MSSSYVDCEICNIGFDAQNIESLFCNNCGYMIGSCCKDDYLNTLSEKDQQFGYGEMLEDKCPCGSRVSNESNKLEVTDRLLLEFAIKKLNTSYVVLEKQYKQGASSEVIYRNPQDPNDLRTCLSLKQYEKLSAFWDAEISKMTNSKGIPEMSIGPFTVEFTPTGVGTCVEVRCNDTGARLNLTEVFG